MEYRALMIGLLISTTNTLMAQWVTGLNGSYTLPLGETFRRVNADYGAGAISLMNRSFCHLWYGIHLRYAPLQRQTDLDSTTLSYHNAVTLSPELRWFPQRPTQLPLYVSIALALTDIEHTPRQQLIQQDQDWTEPSPFGLGFAVGIGYLLFYSSDCCAWFVDLGIQYRSANGLWRSQYRPHIAGLSLQVGLYVKL